MASGKTPCHHWDLTCDEFYRVKSCPPIAPGYVSCCLGDHVYPITEARACIAGWRLGTEVWDHGTKGLGFVGPDDPVAVAPAILVERAWIEYVDVDRRRRERVLVVPGVEVPRGTTEVWAIEGKDGPLYACEKHAHPQWPKAKIKRGIATALPTSSP